MDKMSSTRLKRIRNIIMVAGIVAAFIIWLFIPWVIENNRLVHVGNGRFGSKIGFLLILGLPLFGLIPHRPDEEIHTDDPVERARIEEEWEIASAKLQIIFTAAEGATACFVMFLAIVFG